MTYASSEQSVQGGDVRELYSFALAAGAFHLTSHAEDVVYNSVTYTATPGLSRGNAKVSPLTEQIEMEIVLPRNHPVVLALIPIPPRVARVSIVQIHEGATSSPSDRRQIHYGEISHTLVDGKDAQLSVPGALSVVFDIQVPILRAKRTCQHQLYSKGCTVVRSLGNVKTPTVSSVNGIELVVSSLAGWADQRARGGDVLRTSDGERRTILDHQGNTLIVDVPFATLAPGDALSVAKGCEKSVEDCRGEFLNIRNFGGHPLLPDVNPASPTGRGVA